MVFASTAIFFASSEQFLHFPLAAIHMVILFFKINHHHHLVNLYSYVIVVNYTHIPLLKFFEKK